MSAYQKARTSLFRLLHDEASANFSDFQASKATLIDISHTLEDCILQDRLPSIVFTGFQESNHWQAETERYRELAGIASQICIFAGGKPPVPEEQHVTITLERDDPLRHEWFLLILTHKFSVVLCGLDKQALVDSDAERVFQTILSFDPGIVGRTVDHILPVVKDYRPDRVQALELAYRQFPPDKPDVTYTTRIITRIVDHLQRRYDQQQTHLRELRYLREQQSRLEHVVVELAVPVVPILDGVLALPLVGTIDTKRAQQIMENLLVGIAEQQADIVIIDITGVPIVDTTVANYLIQTIRAAHLIGAQVILTGIGTRVARTLTAIGIDFSSVITRGNLRDGIEMALGLQGRRVVAN